MNPLQIPCTIEGFRTLKDGSVKLDISTQELSGDDFKVLSQYRNRFGFMLFKEAEFSQEDIADVPDVVPEFKSDKTPSERLRAVLFVMHEQMGKDKKDFPAWYQGKMEEIIDHYKAKLDGV